MSAEAAWISLATAHGWTAESGVSPINWVEHHLRDGVTARAIVDAIAMLMNEPSDANLPGHVQEQFRQLDAKLRVAEARAEDWQSIAETRALELQRLRRGEIND